MTLMHALLDSWAYLMVALLCFTMVPSDHIPLRVLGILGAICWVALIARRWMEYNGA